MKYEEIENLVDLVADSTLVEMTIRANGRRVTIRKSAGMPSQREVHGKSAPERENSVLAGAASPKIVGNHAHLDEALHARLITAPMVGIFNHVTPPIIPGTSVKSGQTVGVIESMKLPNDVVAQETGIVRAALVESGTPVEYGQPLFEYEDRT